MKIIHFILFLLISSLGYKVSTACASYAPLHLTNDIENSLGNEYMVELAYTNPIYDNIGMLYYSNADEQSPKDSDFSFLASVVYIGNGICLTSAHAHTNGFCEHCKHHAVCFEINGIRTPLYHVVEFKTHPNYEKLPYFDIAALILNKPVNPLTGLPLCYSFSKRDKDYQDYQHLLTYVHYGSKLFFYDWFRVSNCQRKAMQTYTFGCRKDPNCLGLYSAPYGHLNNGKERPPILYEAKARAEMSGGACIHPDFGLVSIILGNKNKEGTPNFVTTIYLIIAEIIDIILYPVNHYLFTVPTFNRILTDNFTRIHSVPLGPVEDWLEDIRRQSNLSNL